MSDIIKADQAELITAEKVNQFLTAFGIMPNLTPGEKIQCVEIAKEFQLNPFKREIHFIKYDKKAVSIVIGYDVFIKRATRTGLLDGWKVWVEGTGRDLVAKIEISRKDWAKPFIHEVYFAECSGPGPLWSKSPRFMLKKVAIGQGFRLCFPDELGGLPYLPEEIGAEAQDMKTAEPVDVKKPTDEPASPDLAAAGAKVKEYLKGHKEHFPDDAETRKTIKDIFMGFVTAKDEAGAIKYAEELPVFAEVVDAPPVDVEKIAEIFGNPNLGDEDPPPERDLF